MRISSLVATASIAIALTTSTFVIGGRNAEPILAISADPLEQPATAGAASPTSDAPSLAPSDPASDSSAPSQSTATPQPANSAPAEPAATKAPAPAPVAHASDVISYQYGDVQVEVVKLGAEITDVNLLVGDATYGRDAAYQTLIQATIQNQGTNYGNYSGATFTTKAFKLAVESALAKF